VERRVVAKRPKRNARVLVNVAFADLDEAAEFGQTGETHRDRFARERVQDHVHSFAISQFHHSLGKIAAPRVEHVFDAERLEQGALTRAAGRRDDFRAEVERDLNRSHSHAARAGVNEDAFALAQTRHISQGVPRSHEDDRQRRRFLEREGRRDLPDVAASRQRLRRESENGKAEDAVSRSDVGNARSDLRDDATKFIPKNSRVRSIAGIKRQGLEHVAEIHSCRFHFDQYLTRPAWRQFEGREAQGVEATALARFETQRQRRAEPLFAGWTATIESQRIASFTSQGDFAFAALADYFAPKQSCVSFRRQIDRTPMQIRMFVQDDPHQSNARGLCDCGRSQIVAGGLRVARYQIETKLGRRLSGFERLRQMEQSVEIGRHLRSVIKIPKINDPLRQRIRARCNEFFPILQRSRSQSKDVVAVKLETLSLPNDSTSGAKLAQPRNQPITHSGGVLENNPRLLVRSLGLAQNRFYRIRLAREQADLTFAASGTDQSGQRIRFRKTGFLQHGFPLRSLEQWLLRSQVAIGKPPPAAG
jgi:hypothetical protein